MVAPASLPDPLPPAVEDLGMPVLLPRSVSDDGPMPIRYEYSSLSEYESAWHRWRALSRDGRLTNDELEAKYQAFVWELRRRQLVFGEVPGLFD